MHSVYRTLCPVCTVARTVTKYTADGPDVPTIFHAGEEADAEPALPYWRVAVAGFFSGA